MFISRAQLFDSMPAPDPIAHYLVVLEGTSPGQRLEVDSAAVTIGRGASQTLVCDDRDVSRQHARVLLVNGAVTVEDLQSTNGTFVDEQRITGSVPLTEGARIRLGRQLLKYERRSRADVKKEKELERDIKKANDYVMSLLPPPMSSGPVLATWRFVPSAQLGGDAFGYYWLEPTTLILYLVDVSGHGVGSAMHSVSVLNVLRQRALPKRFDTGLPGGSPGLKVGGSHNVWAKNYCSAAPKFFSTPFSKIFTCCWASWSCA